MKSLTLGLIAVWGCFASPLFAQQGVMAPSTMLASSLAGPFWLRLQDPVFTGKGSVLLRWSVNSAPVQDGYFSIERAAMADGPFETLAIQRKGNSEEKFTDEKPLKGEAFYRIKWNADNESPQYSRIVASNPDLNLSCRFYPNPVDNVLIVSSDQPLELLLSDDTGKTRMHVQLKEGLQTADVSGLEKGLYIITLTQLGSGQTIHEKLIKN